MYTATSLDQAGDVTFKAKQIYYDVLLERIFESKSKTTFSGTPANTQSNNRTNTQSDNRSQQPLSNQSTRQVQNSKSTPTNFTFKKENDLYFFGTADQLSVRNIE